MRQLKITKSITNRESASLDKYLQEIGREELITAEEEVILAKKIKDGDQQALEKLTRANLRFVVSVAKQYQNQGLSLPDLINEGNLGLIKAARRFDETRGFKFISYAVWWIRQSILQALAEQSRIVRLPLNQVGSLNKINKAYSKLEQEFERQPSAEELAEALEVPEDKILKQRERYKQKKKEDFIKLMNAYQDMSKSNILADMMREVADKPVGYTVNEDDAGQEDIYAAEKAEREARRAAEQEFKSRYQGAQRNDKCRCGSGLKYKKCCLPKVEKIR
jgi:RNA polymerase sigma factor (sigma-70 family)